MIKEYNVNFALTITIILCGQSLLFGIYYLMSTILGHSPLTILTPYHHRPNSDSHRSVIQNLNFQGNTKSNEIMPSNDYSSTHVVGLTITLNSTSKLVRRYFTSRHLMVQRRQRISHCPANCVQGPPVIFDSVIARVRHYVVLSAVHQRSV